MMPVTMVMTNNQISWRGMPFIAPNLRALHEPAGDFLFAEVFPNGPKSKPLPPELFAQLDRTNLVYYDWEITAERLKLLPQLTQLALMVTRHKQLAAQSAAVKWLNRIGPTLGTTVTEVTQTAPNELSFMRKAPGGLTAIELTALANWLEATNFPGCDLRLPPPKPRLPHPRVPGAPRRANSRCARSRLRRTDFMLKLGVNIDHVATLREARYRGRGFGEPDPVEAARICEAAGAHGITAHLREDRRHIQDRDVWKLREMVKTRLNLEMAVVPEIIAIALKLKPDIVCIVPERRLEVTTEGGLDVVANEKAIADTRRKMNDAGIEVSLFIAPDEKQIEASARTGSQFVELHTGAFAEEFQAKAEGGRRKARHGLTELQRLISGAQQAHALGLKVNAGHGLNYANLPALHRVPHLVELNIGHSIISRAVSVGLEKAVREMLRLMKNYRG